MVEERRETREGEERRGERRSRANRALREGEEEKLTCQVLSVDVCIDRIWLVVQFIVGKFLLVVIIICNITVYNFSIP